MICRKLLVYIVPNFYFRVVKPYRNFSMKTGKMIAAAENFAAADFGAIESLGDYTLELGEVRIPGKVFGGAAVGATGGEFSFQSFAPGAETGFLHTHRSHEELYFFLRGRGEFQVDGRIFPVREGVRSGWHLPAAVRCATTVRSRWRCSACSIAGRPSRPAMPRTARFCPIP